MRSTTRTRVAMCKEAREQPSLAGPWPFPVSRKPDPEPTLQELMAADVSAIRELLEKRDRESISALSLSR